MCAQVPLDNVEQDMYKAELETFIEAVRTGNARGIVTPFEDSALTYASTQWIAQASNSNYRTPSAWFDDQIVEEQIASYQGVAPEAAAA